MGIGFRYIAGDVDSVGFLSDLSVGLRTISVTNGRLLDSEVPLGSYMNNIIAELYLPNQTFLKQHSVRVYRSPENKLVQIKEPQNHSLVNTDMADVKVRTTWRRGGPSAAIR